MLVLDQAQRLATMLLARADLDAAGRIHVLYLRAYGRPPTPVEIQRDLGYLDRFRTAAGSQIPPAELESRAWRSLCRAILAANEFIFVE